VTLAAEAGQLQLNAFRAHHRFSLMQSIRLLTMRPECWKPAVWPESKQTKRPAESISCPGLLWPQLWCQFLAMNALAELAKAILASGKTLRELLIQADDLSPDLIDDMLNAEEMTRPSRARKAKT